MCVFWFIMYKTSQHELQFSAKFEDSQFHFCSFHVIAKFLEVTRKTKYE